MDKPNHPLFSASTRHTNVTDGDGESTTRQSHADSEQRENIQIELTADVSLLSDAEREHRRRVLLAMLSASEARQQQNTRTRSTPLRAGLSVVIKKGPLRHKQGIVLDADYILNRVLVDLDELSGGCWVEFSNVAPLPKPADPQDLIDGSGKFENE